MYAPERMLLRLPDTLVISAGETVCAEDEEFRRLARSGVTVTLRLITWTAFTGLSLTCRCEWEAAGS